MVKKRDQRPTGRQEINLSGREGGTFFLVGCAMKWCRQLKLDPGPILADATSGDYEHLLRVLDDHFGQYVDFCRS